MSRSYKKTPRCGDRKNKAMKKYANHVVRRDTNTYQNSSYKKRFCRYDICDYESVGDTFQDYWNMRVRQWYSWRWRYEEFPNEKEEYRKWYKWFKRK